MTRIRQHHWLISVKLEDLWVSLCPIERFDLYATKMSLITLAQEFHSCFFYNIDKPSCHKCWRKIQLTPPQFLNGFGRITKLISGDDWGGGCPPLPPLATLLVAIVFCTDFEGWSEEKLLPKIQQYFCNRATHRLFLYKVQESTFKITPSFWGKL